MSVAYSKQTSMNSSTNFDDKTLNNILPKTQNSFDHEYDQRISKLLGKSRRGPLVSFFENLHEYDERTEALHKETQTSEALANKKPEGKKWNQFKSKIGRVFKSNKTCPF